MKTFILMANNDEAKHLQDLEIENNNVGIIITGEGRSNVIKEITRCIRYGIIGKDDRVINIGYVGSKGYDKGSIVTVGCVEHLIPSKTIKESCIALNCVEGLEVAGCFTADNFVGQDDINPWMPEKFVCDMELYYLALMFPGIMSIKIVSDSLDYDEYTNANFEESWATVRNKLKEIV